MTNPKKKAAPKQTVSVDVRKLGQGLKATFEGVALVFDALGADAAFPEMKEMTEVTEPAASTEESDRVAGKVEQAEEAEKTKELEAVETAADHDASDAVDKEGTEEQHPVETEPEPVKESAPLPTITADDVTKVIVQKIKQNRGNNAKIGQILKTYGVTKVGELPASKYEAFLTDLASL